MMDSLCRKGKLVDSFIPCVQCYPRKANTSVEANQPALFTIFITNILCNAGSSHAAIIFFFNSYQLFFSFFFFTNLFIFFSNMFKVRIKLLNPENSVFAAHSQPLHAWIQSMPGIL